MNPYSSFDPTKPRRPIKPWSDKRLAKVKDREATVAATKKRANGQCEAAELVREVRCGFPLDVHEMVTRARSGSITDPDNCKLLCRPHHDWVHSNPAKAQRLGLLVSSQPMRQLLFDPRTEGR